MNMTQLSETVADLVNKSLWDSNDFIEPDMLAAMARAFADPDSPAGRAFRTMVEMARRQADPNDWEVDHDVTCGTFLHI